MINIGLKTKTRSTSLQTMTTSNVPPDPTKLEKTKRSINKVIDFLEIMSALLLLISFGSLLTLIIGEYLRPGFAPDDFSFISVDLLCLCGPFALLIQSIEIVMKRPLNCLRIVVIATSIVALPVSLFFGFASMIYLK